MSELEELYQEIVMDHNRRPRNFQRLEKPSGTAEGVNPLCGDQITLDIKVENGVITSIGFQGPGCAISRASASLMTDSVKGKTVEEARHVFEAFHQMITGAEGEEPDADLLGDLEVLSGVAEFPVRVKCATLSWHTLRAALEGQKERISTE